METNPEQNPGERPGLSITRFEIALIAVLLVVWIPGFIQLSEVWQTVEYASHGFLVPLVAAWAATAHREELASRPARPMPGGFPLIAFVAILYALAVAFRNPTFVGVITVAAVVAVTLALRGIEWARTLRFALGYLVFMIPLPVAWVTPIIVQLQLFVSGVAVKLLQAGGVAIFRDGNVLSLPGDVSLFVAEACSGITSLITLLPIAVFVAYFTESQLSRRLILVLAVIPIALAGNLLRVVLTVMLSIHVSVEFATDGPLHEWAGVTTYVIGCLCLIGLGKLMRWLWPEDAEEVPVA